MDTATAATTVVTMHPVGKTIRIEVPTTVGPLGAFRGKTPAARCLGSFHDCVDDEVVDQRVERFTDLDGSGDYWVALFEYSRVVRR